MTSPLGGGRRLDRLTLLVVVAAVVFVGSVLPLPTAGADTGVVPDPFGVGADKLVHAASYALIAGLAVVGTRVRGAEYGFLGLVAIVLGVAAFGAGVEVVQSVVPGRTASGGDAVANAVGAAVGVVAVLGWWTLARRSRAERG